ncbi:4-oxalocrotonate tautomerase family protein [Microvirga aerilata]|jgi:4-oxalocrotonate tautomerase|uniref:4-oxalocrotonate tautomerase family protein n=1 Tax=Microvirga aerilata TaxID=670292 RepID=A0A936ZB24_9HYPH|nr:4-oxalocrotonate tautomerase family protein [Microvirga aerilata]MBL0403617.1 4-oxalocrotonate tautomerase family protein [Microvirga aerilata]
MPILNLKVSAAPSPELSQKLAGGLVEVTARILRKRPEITAVAIDYTSPEHWIVGGQSLAQQGKASFWLDIKVVDGTNTKDEKAQYLAEVFTLMGSLLGGELHQESYVLVHEVPADAYGFGGLTQEYRYVEGKLGSRLAA